MKSFIFTLFGIVNIFYTFEIYSQEIFLNYNETNSNIISNNVTCVVIDSNRAIWIGTDAGIGRFDGSGWQTYTTAHGLVDNEIRASVIDSSGNIWFATAGGVSRFNGSAFTNYTENEGLIDDNVQALAVDIDGDIWIGTAKGTCEINGENFSKKTSGLINDNVQSIAIEGNGNIWFGTSGGASKYDGSNWTTYKKPGAGLPSNDIRSIVIDPNNTIWFGTKSGIAKFDGSTWISYTKQNSGLIDNKVNVVFIDLKGNIWIGTEGGINKFNGSSWSSFSQDNSNLNTDMVTSVANDIRDNLWFGTDNGVYKYLYRIDLLAVLLSDSTVNETNEIDTIEFTLNNTLKNSDEIIMRFPEGFTFTNPLIDAGGSSSTGALPEIKNFSSNTVTLHVPDSISPGNIKLVLKGVNNPADALRNDTLQIICRENSTGDTLVYSDLTPVLFNISGKLSLLSADILFSRVFVFRTGGYVHE